MCTAHFRLVVELISARKKSSAAAAATAPLTITTNETAIENNCNEQSRHAARGPHMWKCFGFSTYFRQNIFAQTHSAHVLVFSIVGSTCLSLRHENQISFREIRSQFVITLCNASLTIREINKEIQIFFLGTFSQLMFN